MANIHKQIAQLLQKDIQLTLDDYLQVRALARKLPEPERDEIEDELLETVWQIIAQPEYQGNLKLADLDMAEAEPTALPAV